jgi:hypothetical protein
MPGGRVIQTVYGIASRLFRVVKPVRDSKYLAFIRTFPCCGCGQSWWIEAAHTGPHAYSKKASDLLAIPLCRKCHEKFDKAPAKFAYANHIDVEALTTMFQHLYRVEFPERHQEAA